MSPRGLRPLLLIIALAGCAPHARAQQPPRRAPQPVKEEALRRELRKMYEADQALRLNHIERGYANLTAADVRAQNELDAAHTRRLLEIIKQYGFPGPALVGVDGADAAHTLVSHSPSLTLKRKALSYYKRALRRGEVPPDAVANLTDIILHDHLHKPQLYGTRFDKVGDKMVLQNVKDPARLEERRRKLGLMPLAEYARLLEELYKMPVDITAVTSAARH